MVTSMLDLRCITLVNATAELNKILKDFGFKTNQVVVLVIKLSQRVKMNIGIA